MNQRNSRIVDLLILTALVVIVFANVLSNEFVWDDFLYLINVEAYRTLAFKNFFLMLGNGNEYLPIRDISYSLDYTFWGEQPKGFHFTNLALYLLNIFAVYFLSEMIVTTIQMKEESAKLLKPATVAFWTAVFFALHPIHCETVNFIGGGRNTLLATLFTLLSCRSFFLFLAGNKNSFLTRDVTASFFWYVLAVLSKATAVSLPLFLLAICLILKYRPLITRIAATIPFFFVSGLVYYQYTSIAVNTGIISRNASDSLTAANRIATATQIPFFYLWKFIVPTNLSVDYGSPFSSSLTSPFAIASIFTIIVFGLSAYAFRISSPMLYIAFCWYGAFIIPVLHLLPTSVVVADRYNFLPSFAFCFLLAYLGVKLGTRWPYLITTAGIVMCLVLGILSFNQNKVWKSNLSLWQHTVSVSPRSVQAMENLGTIYFYMGEYAKALDVLYGIQKMEPLNPIYDFFEGKYFYELGNLQRATTSFEHAIEKKSDLIDALYYLADISEKTKNFDRAISYYQLLIASKDIERGPYKKIAKERLAIICTSVP